MSSPVSIPVRRRTGRKWTLRVLAALVLLVALVYATGITMYYAFPAKREPVWTGLASQGPLNIAHQGGELLAPSNTLAAFAKADSMQADVLELDIHMTRDGHLVVIHDATVDRTTDGQGRVDDYDLAELQKLDAGYAFKDLSGAASFRGQGVYIPTLEEVFERYADRYYFNIEIKGKYPREGESQIEAKLWELIQRYKLESKTVVVSFADERLEAFADLSEGRVALGAGSDEARRFVLLTKAGLAGFYRPQADVLQLPVESSGISLKDKRLIDTAHRLNMQVHYWTIDDEATMRELLKLGADGIITNRPDLLKQVLAELHKQ